MRGISREKTKSKPTPVLDPATSVDTSDLRELRLRSPAATSAASSAARLYFGSSEAWQVTASNQTAELARQRGLDVEAMMVPGDHFTLVPEAIRQSIEFFGSH